MIVHLADIWSRHHVLDIQQSQDWDGRSQEESQTPGEDYFVEDGVLSLRSLSQRLLDSSVSACSKYFQSKYFCV